MKCLKDEVLSGNRLVGFSVFGLRLRNKMDSQNFYFLGKFNVIFRFQFFLEFSQNFNMPGAIGQMDPPKKRKSIASDKRPSKRARSESSEEDAQDHILLLENEIFESKKNYNNITTLIKILRSDGGDDSIIASVSLCRVFTKLMAAGDMVKSKESTEKDVVVVRWLKERYSEYKATLLGLLEEEDYASTALTLSMRLLKTEGQYLRNGQEYAFPTVFLTKIVQVLLQSGNAVNTRKEFSEKFVEEYDDVRFYTLEAVE